ncbi:hypothetical protein QR98_0100670 [Sarcoptes scabiei]|uniref:Uncharacterized protein n=1 Tax=Sarcoptes scabiei TaxID=52283 RepID=A0A132ALM7_SARSC|nr:hypothetical protein QR98_0100670 [Sarcoptes scabiei]
MKSSFRSNHLDEAKLSVLFQMVNDVLVDVGVDGDDDDFRFLNHINNRLLPEKV